MLSEAKEVTARALTEQLIREERSLIAYDQLEIFCEQFLARLEAIAREKGMPTDLVTCLCTLVYAAPRVDVEELKKVAANLELRYGTLWADGCHSNLHAQVHEKVCDNLGIGRIKGSVVDAEMTKIAQEFEVDWSPLVPTPDEQEFNSTVLAAQRLSDHGIKAPIPTSSARKSPLLSSQPSSHHQQPSHSQHYPHGSHDDQYYENSNSTSAPMRINPASFSQNSPEPSAPSASPPLEYVRMTSLASSGVEEELLMIDMLPEVPQNREISMAVHLQGSEGGSVVTHEHDDGDLEDSTSQDSKWIIRGDEDLDLTNISDERKKVYEAVFATQSHEIPASPVWNEPKQQRTQHSSTSHPVAASAPEVEEDPLLARMRRLKGT